jgi:hypothetical protein
VVKLEWDYVALFQQFFFWNSYRNGQN